MNYEIVNIGAYMRAMFTCSNPSKLKSEKSSHVLKITYEYNKI